MKLDVTKLYCNHTSNDRTTCSVAQNGQETVKAICPSVCSLETENNVANRQYAGSIHVSKPMLHSLEFSMRRPLIPDGTRMSLQEERTRNFGENCETVHLNLFRASLDLGDFDKHHVSLSQVVWTAGGCPSTAG